MLSKRLIATFLLLICSSIGPAYTEANEGDADERGGIGQEATHGTDTGTAVFLSGPPHKQKGVQALTDETFEHVTQASTGQTTGSWLVWFHGKSGDDDEPAGTTTTTTTSATIKMRGEFPNDSVWLEQHTLVASVNVDDGGQRTADRLQVSPIPSFLYIHRGKMYPYPSKQADYSWEALLAFCRAPDETLAQDIPAPPSLFEHLMFKVAADKTNLIVIGGMIMVMVLGLFFGAVVGHFGDKHAAEKSKRD